MKYHELHNFPANIAIFRKKQLDKVGNIAINHKQIHPATGPQTQGEQSRLQYMTVHNKATAKEFLYKNLWRQPNYFYALLNAVARMLPEYQFSKVKSSTVTLKSIGWRTVGLSIFILYM